MDYIVAYVISTTILLILLHYFFKKHSDLPPGPWNLPIVGYLPWVDNNAPHITLTKLARKFGPIYGLYLGGIYTVVVSEIKLMRKIQWKDESTGRPPLYLNRLMTFEKGIVNAQGELWRNQRKFVLNYFKTVGASKISLNRQKLEHDITTQVLDFMKYVEELGTPLDPNEVLVHNAASVSSLLWLGKCFRRDDETWLNLLRNIREILQVMGFAGPLNFLPFLRFLPTYRAHVNLIKETMTKLVNTIGTIAEINKQSPHHDSYNLVQAFFNEKLKGDQLHIHTDFQLKCLLNDLFITAMETIVTSMTWYFLYMAVYQEVQAEVRRELREILHQEIATMDHMPFLPYLRASLAEVARISTTVPLSIPHCALENMNVEGVRIPKGAMVVSLLWAVHMDPAVWKDPEIFRPERFLDEDGKFYKPESFAPFHTGKRVCAGEEMANMMMFLFAANVMNRFRIECQDRKLVDLNGIPGVTFQPKPQKLVFTKI